MDVANEEAVEGGVAAVVKAFGGVDILVSNAGPALSLQIVEFAREHGRVTMALPCD